MNNLMIKWTKELEKEDPNSEIEMIDMKFFIENIHNFILNGEISFNEDKTINSISKNVLFEIQEYILHCITEEIERCKQQEKNTFLKAINDLKLVDNKYPLSKNLFYCEDKNDKMWYLGAILKNNAYIKANKDFYKKVLSYIQTSAIEKSLEFYDMFNKSSHQDYNKNNTKKNNDKFTGGFVYIGKQTNESGLYKIGTTKKLSERLSTFKCGNCFIEFIMTKQSDNPYFLENKLHTIFKHRRYEREWFKLDDDDFELLSEFGFNYCIR